MRHDHEITAPINSGEVRVERTLDGGRSLDWTVSDLRRGRWSCSCGEEFDNEREAAQHYDDTR